MSKWRYQEGTSRKENEYCEDFICSNCGEKNYVYIEKGIPIEMIKAEVECDNCGCKV